MDIMSIVLAIGIVSILGLLGAIILVVASHFLSVKEDERISLITEALPGANCGACGCAGCADYAKSIVEGGNAVNKCIPGGKKTAAEVGEIMGVKPDAVESRKAVVLCQGHYNNTSDKYDYQGIQTCAASNTLYNGRTACRFGCLGFGDCVAKCKFGALKIENGCAIVDVLKCTGCGACATACPNNLIDILPESVKPVVLCKNKERGALTRKGCSAGCIGCMKCQKECPAGAITVSENVATIDPAKCIGCSNCVSVCPVGAIVIPNDFLDN